MKKSGAGFIIAILIFACSVTSVLLGQLEYIRRFDGFLFDIAIRMSQPRQISGDSVAILVIDDKTLDTIEDPMVLWAGYFGEVLDGLSKAEAKVIAMDMIPSVSLDKFNPELDKKLLSALIRAKMSGTRVIYGFKEGDIGRQAPHPKFRLMSSGLGFINLFPGPDSVNREYARCFVADNKRISPSLALITAYFLSGDKRPLWEYSSKGEICANNSGKMLIDYRYHIRKENIVSFSDALEMIRNNETEKLSSIFGGKAVFVGVTSARLPDMHKVPYNTYSPADNHIPGVLLHAYSMISMIHPDSLQRHWDNLAPVAALASGAALALSLLFFSPARAMMIAGAIPLLWFILGLGFFSWGMVIPFWPVVASVIAAIGLCGPYVYFTEYRRRSEVSKYFKSYVSSEALEEILNSPETIDFSGNTVTATVMFSDIRGFTSMSEKVEPKKLVEGLNEYFTEMTGAITEAGGYVNKYLGDGILAVFGAPGKAPRDGALAAANGAMAMLESMDRINREKPLTGFGRIKIGIGLHCGEAIMGNIGCYQKMDYSLIGDTVNTASRVEAMTKTYDLPILLTQAVHDRIKDSIQLEYVGQSEVRGKENKVHLYTFKDVKRWEDS